MNKTFVVDDETRDKLENYLAVRYFNNEMSVKTFEEIMNNFKKVCRHIKNGMSIEDAIVFVLL